MNQRTFATRAAFAALALGLAAALSGCRSTSKEVDTLKAVDQLVGRVEILHFEVELAKRRSENALDALAGLASNGFRGDPVLAFEQFVQAVELSEKQAKALKDAVLPMHKTAERVFAQWSADTSQLRIDSLRERSQRRLEETRARYLAIVATADHVQKAYDAYNVGLRDHATYLGNDFNASSLAEIQQELSALARWSKELDQRFDACMMAAERYVAASALPNTVEVAQAAQG